MPSKFELFQDKGGKFRFRLKAANGQTILASQGYKTKTTAINGIGSVQRNSVEGTRFERRNGRGKFRFNIKATNGRIVGSSEAYDTEKACDKGVQSVMKSAPGAKVVDLTVG